MSYPLACKQCRLELAENAEMESYKGLRSAVSSPPLVGKNLDTVYRELTGRHTTYDWYAPGN